MLIRSALAASLALAAVFIAAPKPAAAAPVAPAVQAGDLLNGQSGIQDVRWVRNCRTVWRWRPGGYYGHHMEPVQECRREWVAERDRRYNRRYDRYDRRYERRYDRDYD
jgi:hypothetical protein